MKINIDILRYITNKEINTKKILNKLNYYGFETTIQNNFLDISIPYNRSNCNNILSIINEIYPNEKFLFLLKDLKKINRLKDVSIEIKNKNFCPKYSLLLVNNIDNNIDTPDFIKNILINNGFNTINLIIDILNYCFIITGQTYHAYDYDKIEKKIQIKKIKEEYSFSTINKKNIKIKDCYVVTDGKKILALPGIIGGYESKVTKNSKNILIECAIFNKFLIKKFLNKYNIKTKSSEIFKKGINIKYNKLALSFLIQILEDLVKFQNIFLHQKCYKRIEKFQKILKIKKKYISKKLGFNITKKTIEKSFKNRGLISKNKKNTWYVNIPYHRSDLINKENLITELLKYFKLKNIPKKAENTSSSIKNYKNEIKKNIIEYLISNGFLETINYSFVNLDIEKQITKKNIIKIRNPINKNFNAMRSSLLQGLLKSAALNLNKGINNIKLFELNTVWINKKQEISCACICTEEKTTNIKKYNYEIFYVLKNIIENIYTKLYKIKNFSFIKNKKNEYFDEKIQSKIKIKKKTNGFLGLINKNFLKIFDIKENLYFFEIILSKINFKKILNKFKNISKYPKIERDMSFIINKNINFEEIINKIKSIKINILKQILLIDVYEISDVKKSVTIKFIFQSKKKTLKDKDINVLMTYIYKKTKQNLDIYVKGFDC